MSYIYLLEQGEESSAECFLDIAPYVLLRLNHIQGVSCCKGSEMESFHGFRSGMMSALLMESRGEELSMLYAEASLVRTYPAYHTTEKAFREKKADCGWKWQESSVKWSPDTYSWKTRQCSLLEGLDEFSETWPRWGIMQNGECWELATPALRMNDSASGYWPTPQARDWKNATAKEWENRKRSRAVNRKLAWIYKHSTKKEERLGQVNPDFHLWLMGWPIGWNALNPLETDKFQQWLLSHGRS